MASKLFAPENYITAPVQVKEAIINGCGAGGWKLDLIPDTLYGLDVSECCNIHDWMYTQGSTLADKEEADRVFLNNLLRMVDDAGGWWILKRLRRNRAAAYYYAVHMFGGPSFWQGKNDCKNLVAA